MRYRTRYLHFWVRRGNRKECQDGSRLDRRRSKVWQTRKARIFHSLPRCSTRFRGSERCFRGWVKTITLRLLEVMWEEMGEKLEF